MPFRSVRTRPLQAPKDTTLDSDLRPKPKPPIVAALVPTGRPRQEVFPAALQDAPVSSRGLVRKDSAASRRSSGSAPGTGRHRDGGTVLNAAEFGLEVTTALPGTSPPLPLHQSSYNESSAMHPSSLSFAQLSSQSEPEVDEDGVYTMPVPGGGRCVLL